MEKILLNLGASVVPLAVLGTRKEHIKEWCPDLCPKHKTLTGLCLTFGKCLYIYLQPPSKPVAAKPALLSLSFVCSRKPSSPGFI